ncbi:23S rRNA (uracil(1939)-C(5))-methyltransferase RlmD [Thalassotalea sp. PS06]|uniref:23S rRNA (uracil(1939)-C(5))-methyltransferase RlmD n=1 Tax=Thalassotalea sp. PS06 TaxID=2594005 RepID=UPI001163BB0C|nr:23S rRNA (uracil(1939)-C(5))-methyltransferase RlmD [Thalassotalea sp. PS06]QDP02007.1 23S rRNA (uracil(1939)-C(5))-methyltransferase RlmD [Thalassotalea sp. PS06]
MVKIFKSPKRQNNTEQKIQVDILRFDMNGDGVARHGQKSVFVAGALPGETVEAKVVCEQSKFIRAKAIKVSNANAQRITPDCKHFYQCGGCDFQHMDGELELSVKKQKIDEVFKRNAGAENLPWQPPVVSEPWHYRRKARIGVQYNRLNEPSIGFRQKNSKHITPIKSCPTLVRPLADVFPPLQKLIEQLAGRQVIGHVEAFYTAYVTLVFRYLGKLSEKNRQSLRQFGLEHDYRILVVDDQQTIDLSANGNSQLSYQIDDCQLYFSPRDFIQVNAELNKAMVEQAIAWLSLDMNDSVLDLFCGLGNFSLPIAKRVNSLVGVEGVQEMVDRATANAKANGVNNCQFYQADLNAENLVWPWQENLAFNKVLLDPARAGAIGAIKPIAELGVDKVLYISCDAATMARDSQLLLASGYKLEKIALLDMFAQTRHVETMALFHKTNPR